MTSWKKSAVQKVRHLKRMAIIMSRETYFEDAYWMYVKEYAEANIRRIAEHNGHYKRGNA